MSYNHIVSCEDQYNELVDAIESAYFEAFPDGAHRGIFGMLHELQEAAKFRKKHSDLVMSDIQHSRDTIAGWMSFLLNPKVHLEIDGDAKEDEGE